MRQELADLQDEETLVEQHLEAIQELLTQMSEDQRCKRYFFSLNSAIFL